MFFFSFFKWIFLVNNIITLPCLPFLCELVLLIKNYQNIQSYKFFKELNVSYLKNGFPIRGDEGSAYEGIIGLAFLKYI